MIYFFKRLLLCILLVFSMNDSYAQGCKGEFGPTPRELELRETLKGLEELRKERPLTAKEEKERQAIFAFLIEESNRRRQLQEAEEERMLSRIAEENPILTRIYEKSASEIRLMIELPGLKGFKELLEYYAMNDDMLGVLDLKELHSISPATFRVVQLSKIQATLTRATDEQFLMAIRGKKNHTGISIGFLEQNIHRIPSEDIYRFPKLKEAPQSVRIRMNRSQRKAVKKMEAVSEENPFINYEMFEEVADVSEILKNTKGIVHSTGRKKSGIADVGKVEKNQVSHGWRRFFRLFRRN